MSTKRQSWLATAARPCSIASMTLLIRVRSWAPASSAAKPPASSRPAISGTASQRGRRELVDERRVVWVVLM